ncbi:PatA/PatG family cyanobactin maturation protease [Leptothoe sp. ISB3NOV94-8A]
MPDFAAIPGFAALQSLTLGDSRIKIAVLDGPADLDRTCFKGANLSRVNPYWQEELEPIDPVYIQQELKIRALTEQRKALKKSMKECEKQDAEIILSTPTDGNGEPRSQLNTQVTPSELGCTTGPLRKIFNALLEDMDAPLREHYRQLRDAKQLSSPSPKTLQNIDHTAAIDALEAEIKELVEAIPESVKIRLNGVFHATGIFGTMFGQPGSPVEGIAPHCTAINIPLFETATTGEALSPLSLAHAFNLARDLGVHIIHCAACHPTQTGFAHEMIQKAVQQCQENNILIVAPAGNDKGECFCVPAVLPNVLSVGMMKDDGQPASYSNWGGQYQHQGILAPGENIVAAQPGTNEPARQEGTSLSAPLMTGLSALLMSLQLQRGEQPNAEAVRLAWLNSALPCDPETVEEPERCLAGRLNLAGAYHCLTGQSLPGVQPATVMPSTITRPTANLLALGLVEPAPIHAPVAPLKAAPSPEPTPILTATVPVPQPVSLPTVLPAAASAPVAPPATTLSSATVTPSAVSNKVYALGTIGYDFGTEARRDTFKQKMPAVASDGTIVPANPYDARQMVNYLDQNPTAAKSLIWTLNLDLNPIYVVEPKNAFANDIYETLIQMLAGQLEAENSEDYIERVSIPGRLQHKTVDLFSGQVLPVVEIENSRGMYGWQVNELVRSAFTMVRDRIPTATDVAMQRSLDSFLQRIYFELGNLGQLARERALNFAATNAFQAASTFAEAIALGMQLDSIEVEKSPFCRINSDCWDVILMFLDPENSHRAKKVFRFTIDVKDTVPVTLGDVRSWSVLR